MRTLVYRRTHKHDPDARGCFGIQDCMGSFRDWAFDAVIGVGGVGFQARRNGLDRKVNWIGIGAHRHRPPQRWRGSLVTFDHFILFEEDGPDFGQLAPQLSARIYATDGRCPFINFSREEQAEIDRILKLAEGEPASTWTLNDLPGGEPICHPDNWQPALS